MFTLTRSTATKIFASVALVGGAASVAGLGTFGAFTSTTAVNGTVTNGKVVLSAAAGPVRGIDIAATDVVPGDTVQRSVTLTRSSDTSAFGSVALTTSGSVSNLLTTDTTNGLQLKIDQCSVAWAKAPTTNDLTCAGTTTAVIAQRPVIGTGLDLGAATTTLNAAGAVSYLRVTLTLPSAAGNTLQGLGNTIGFTFDATQRAAEAR
ncbi:TasA family protein [Nocardioides sp. GCM10027113]|uniref:TasA family protein n=1 Tax=unclassified Nocardioides TaxID=2615069 RepID=UPI00361073C6